MKRFILMIVLCLSFGVITYGQDKDVCVTNGQTGERKCYDSKTGEPRDNKNDTKDKKNDTKDNKNDTKDKKRDTSIAFINYRKSSSWLTGEFIEIPFICKEWVWNKS